VAQLLQRGGGHTHLAGHRGSRGKHRRGRRAGGLRRARDAILAPS
jgi:hypothetical protein